jgi:hypothetical protein
MALPMEVLTEIYGRNFHRLAGPVPKGLDMDLLEEELDRIAALVGAGPMSAGSAWSTWRTDKPLAI